MCSDDEILEASFIKHVRETTHINDEGRVCVKMPWKPGYPGNLPNNYKAAASQMMRRERKLIQNGKIDAYNNEIQDLVNRKVVRILSEEETKDLVDEPGWYLNHRIVERLDKETSKLRVVFDSAAKYRGICLNDALEKGPNFTKSLFHCILMWRMYEFAVCGDMSKMFNQISVDVDDQRYHRFLWRYGNLAGPILIFQWLRVLFGDKPSPDLAAFAIKYLSDMFMDTYPLGARTLKDNTYIDDVGYSKRSEEEANTTMKEIDDILSKGKFTIKKWHSNSLLVDPSSENDEVDYLGHTWNKRNDTIKNKMIPVAQFDDVDFTKRNLLSLVAKIWDPLGYLLPVTIKYRLDLQKIWQDGFGWDDQLPIDKINTWKTNMDQMRYLGDIIIKRCLIPKGVVGKPQLHAFSDGGDSAFGTCVYIRWPTVSGIKLVFVCAKAFVAPLKRKTIPRLELMGAVAMSRLMNEISSSLTYEFESKSFWIDSEVVLYWLHSSSSRYKPFVSSRIQEFQDTHPNWQNEVRYVPSKENPADCLTKYINVEEIKMWYEAAPCSFLSMTEDQWPMLKAESLDEEKLKPYLEENSPLQERRKKLKYGPRVSKYEGQKGSNEFLSANAVTDPAESERNPLELFSTWNDLVRAISCMKQIFDSRSFLKKIEYNPEYIRRAQLTLFLISQKELREDLNGTKRRFIRYNPSIDKDGLIRGKGRLEKIDLPYQIKYPVILPGEQTIVRKFAAHHHKRLLHQGYRVVLANLINDRILIGGGKDLLKSISAKCLFCRMRRRLLLQQQMGDLPEFRVPVQRAPFTSVAIDFFGFLKIKKSRNASVNGSVMIVACMKTRCIHLELCSLIDTNSFLQAWRRFISRRGIHLHHAFSDEGGAFIGASQPIADWIQNWNHQLIQDEFNQTSFDFKWKYNTPTASHMNGAVESLINSVRKGLDASVTNYTRVILTFEDWSTVLSEVTYVINSRPLYPEGDPWDFNCITGNTILHPYGQPDVPQFVEEDVSHIRKMFNVVQCKVDIFWKTWMKHLPPQLNSRNKWYHPRKNLEVGDFVLVFESGFKGKSIPRSMWKKAIVTEVHPGDDGLVRRVTIKDSNHHTYVRPIHKLCLIATREELENED